MHRYLLFNKPFQVLTQFTDDSGRATLADFIDIPEVYSAGRLDYDSEGLLLLTNDGPLIHSMMNPKFKVPKTYLAQVEGQVTEDALALLRQGVDLKDGMTRPAKAQQITDPNWLWPRDPPIRKRQSIPTSWIELTLTEGKNRQVRRMTAATGFPTLRLIRTDIGHLSVLDIPNGEYREITKEVLADNGIKSIPKKSSSKAASRPKAVTRSDQRPRRNQRPHSRSRKV